MSWLDKNQTKIFVIFCGILVFFTLLIGLSVHGKCASSTNTVIPYNVAEWSGYNQMMLDRVDIAIQQYKTAVPGNADKPLLIWTLDGFYGGNWFYYYIMPSPYFDSNIVENFDFSHNTIRFKTDYEIVGIIVGLNGEIGGTVFPHNSQADLLGNSASVNTAQGYYLPRYPFYYDGEPILSTNNFEVLISRVNGQAPSGSATEPDLTGDNIGNDKPDIDDYLPDLPSQPSFDNSSLESMVESIYNWLIWEYNVIKGTLEGLIAYLSDTISYGIQKVIDNIKNSMKNFYDNMKSLFEPLLNGISELISSISQKVEYITEPLNSSEIQGAFEDTSLYGIVSTFETYYQTFDNVFNNTQEPDSLIIPIHLENISVLASFGVGTQYIDLVQFSLIRTPLRTFCWVFCSFGFVLLVGNHLPDWLKGSSGSSGGKE